VFGGVRIRGEYDISHFVLALLGDFYMHFSCAVAQCSETFDGNVYFGFDEQVFSVFLVSNHLVQNDPQRKKNAAFFFVK